MQIRLPSLIDIHVHLRDPGQTEKEDISSGTRAALAGGFSLVCDMPNNIQLIDTPEKFEEKRNIAKQKTVCDIGFYAGTLGDNLSQFSVLRERASGLKVYLNKTTGGYSIGPDLLPDIFSAWSCEKPILCHAEGEMVEKVIQVISDTGQRAHICHVSRKDELETIMRAKERGISITCGVTPHHLYLTDQDIDRLGGFGMMKPPLCRVEDQSFLWEHLSYIDSIESDHAPHTKKEKQSPTPPFGVPGLETTLPLLLTSVYEDRLSQQDLIRLLHTGPLQILSLPSAYLHEISSLERTYTDVEIGDLYPIDTSIGQSKCHWSPFDRRMVRGRVLTVVIRGKTVYDHHDVLVEPGWGKVL